MFLTTSKDFNDFLKENALWMALSIAGVILVLIGMIFLIHNLKKKNPEGKPAKRKIDATAYVAALGGEENILSHKVVRSRIVLELKDYQIVDQEKLKEAGVDALVFMSNKLTLVIEGDAEKIHAVIFGENADA